MNLKKIARRTFILGSTALAGGIAFGYWKYKSPHDNPLLDQADENSTVFSPYVLCNKDGISIIAPRAEMGQGVHTTLAALVAEELDVCLDQVNVLHGPASKAYYNKAVLEEGVPFVPMNHGFKAEKSRQAMGVLAKFLSMQITGGSSTTPDGYTKMRQAGAAARVVFLKAAAKHWDQDIAELKTDSGKVISTSGQSISYIKLLDHIDPKEALNDMDQNITLKDKKDWKLLGKSQKRVDMLSKCTGSAEFSIDVVLPNMLYGTVHMNPHLESGADDINIDAIKQHKGIKKVIQLKAGGVAILANNTWYAIQAAKHVEVKWKKARYPATTQEHFDALEVAFSNKPNSTMLDKGNVVDELNDTSDNNKNSFESMSMTYKAPYLAHATMEPVNATALYNPEQGSLDIWAGNQNPTQVLKEGAAITGLKESAIKVNTTYMGGGFGRRVEMDFIKYAIETAYKIPNVPVKLTWSREEDMTHDSYRPLAMAKVSAAIDTENKSIHAYHIKAACPSVIDSQMGRMGQSIPGPDVTIVQGLWEQGYNIDNHLVQGFKSVPLLPVSSWRSVGASQNAFFQESAIDELAHTLKEDPIVLRSNMLDYEPSLQVIEKVKAMANWDNRKKQQGFAYCLSFGVPVAQIVEIDQNQDGQIIVEKIYAAVDVGTALDPRNIETQVQSAIIFGLSAAIKGEITVADYKVQQTNFHAYDGLRMYQCPDIEVSILENQKNIRGIGEPGVPPVAPALANAIFATTGKRIREMPFNKSIDFA